MNQYSGCNPIGAPPPFACPLKKPFRLCIKTLISWFFNIECSINMYLKDIFLKSSEIFHSKYSIRQKIAPFFKLVAELCKFLGRSWKVIFNIQQLSQLLYCTQLRTGNEGWFCQKKTSQLKWKGPKKKQKSVVFLNRKIFYCKPTSATGELKKEVNARI